MSVTKMLQNKLEIEIINTMKRIGKHDKILKFTYIKYTLITLFVSFFFINGFVPFETTGDNLFRVFLNGVQVGTLGEKEEIDKLFVAARKNIASESEELLFMDVNLSVTGEEVLWAQIDDEKEVLANMERVMQESIQETMQHSYTIKVNEYMVNLASEDEVLALLQAAIGKYDTENRFVVQLVRDEQREFNVLTTQVMSKEEKNEKEALSSNDYMQAGVQLFFDELDKAEPEKEEMGFEDYEYGILNMDFAEDVEIVEAYLPSNQLTNLQTAIDEVIKEQETPGVYEIVAGDTLSEISIKVDIPMDKIVEMNSDKLENENSPIRVGDNLIITIPQPELSVERTELNYIEEIYDEEIIYVDNNEWYTNQTKVLQQPSAGFRKIVADVTYLNDKEVSKEILKEEVVMEAVPKIVERGTKIPPTYIKPLSGGRLSSGFGRRKAPTRGASSYHKGIDWATPTGTAVFASCGGTVAKAGWGSGYGYVVYINHEDGRQTRYAHLSKVLVKAGEKVKQGERIALSGNTGVSSGPHVHFEILINGSQVNPLNYLN